MNIERVNDDMFTVDGQLVEEFGGNYEFASGVEMNWYQLRAILEFIEMEEQNLRILARKSVENLLIELGIKSYRNG